MLNEFIFLLQIILISILSFTALKFGKSALVSFITLQCITANLFVTKQITLFGLAATGTDIFTVGIVLSLNLLQEFYGAEQTARALGASFFAALSFMAFGAFQVWYTPNQFDLMHPSFCKILNFTPRITIASIMAFLVSQGCSIAIFELLKKAFNNKHFTLRSTLTNSLTQTIDTVIFSFAALYGIVQSIPQIILLSLAIKTIAIILTTICTGFVIFFRTR